MNRSLKKFLYLLSPFFIFILSFPFISANVKAKSEKSKITTASSFAGLNTIEKSTIYAKLNLSSLGLSKDAFDNAFKGYEYLRSQGKLRNDDVLTIVDFSLPSSEKRLFVIDLKNQKVLFNTYVAHGRNSGKEIASQFSNDPESFKSSLGFYVTKNTYSGTHGFSLRLEGEEKGINDNALSRAIVMHSADYVNKDLINSQGYIGRSLGCPALPKEVYKPIIEKIKDGSCLFMYSSQSNYITKSKLLQSATILLASNNLQSSADSLL